jgi:YD repeat-containing protein
VFEDKRFKYDVHGNLIENKVGAHTILAFRYDAEHQLIEVDSTRFANDEKKRFSQTIRFDYDALGRRVTKQSEFKRTQFLWDGNRLLSETHLAFPSPLRGEGAAQAAGEGDSSIVTRHSSSQEVQRTLTHLYEPDSFVPMARIVTEPLAQVWTRPEDRHSREGENPDRVHGVDQFDSITDRPASSGQPLDLDNYQQSAKHALLRTKKQGESRRSWE